MRLLTRNTARLHVMILYVFSGASTVTIPIAALLDNDSDINGDRLTVSSLSNILGGNAVLDGQGNIVVTRIGASGTHVTFDYTISDGQDGSARASFDVAMVSNTAPVIASANLCQPHGRHRCDRRHHRVGRRWRYAGLSSEGWCRPRQGHRGNQKRRHVHLYAKHQR